MKIERFHVMFGDSANYWEEDPDFPRAEWKRHVCNADTLLGYWDWVVEQLTPDEIYGTG